MIRTVSFQSLSGFQVRCNSKICIQSRPTIGFQSLSGFQVRCNHDIRAAVRIVGHSFNPYRVFKFVATLRLPGSQGLFGARFNPYRVFKFVATPGGRRIPQNNLHVSIPIGFSSSLQLGDVKFGEELPAGFQSLSGFQVRCNAWWAFIAIGIVCIVSIPIGFSSSLQHYGLRR